MERIEWEDVQRIVLSGYPCLPYSAYMLWQFRAGGDTLKKEWLADLSKRLTAAIPGDPSSIQQPAINLALTVSGLKRLGIGEPELNSFSLEFLEGMAPKRTPETPIPRRTNILGDLGASSPECWDWGGWKEKREIDGLLLLFAADEKSLQKLIEIESTAISGIVDGNPIVLKGRLYPDMKEHFGYVDGLSQPKIEGRPKREENKHLDRNDTFEIRPGSEVKPGEFLLGYLNERRSRVSNGHGRDLRRNGTYLVFRQLEQDVPAFNMFLSNLAGRIGEDEEWVAARLLGRRRDGEPLAAFGSQAPDSTRPGANAAKSKNRFLYYYEDRSGLTCPIGAHIRRANPRDSLPPDPETALRLSKMHRIIRRGRPYGERLDPQKPGGERGMLFIALNADIAGQFEMIQHSWLNNPHFDGLYTGTDPISHFSDGSITIQNRPVNLQVSRPAPFVRVRGGAYFFLPGMQALRSMAA